MLASFNCMFFTSSIIADSSFLGNRCSAIILGSTIIADTILPTLPATMLTLEILVDPKMQINTREKREDKTIKINKIIVTQKNLHL